MSEENGIDSDYLKLIQDRPDLFENESGGIHVETDPIAIHKIEDATRERLVREGMPAEYARVGVVYEDQYLCLLRDAVTFPNSSINTYIRFINKPGSVFGVAILPIFKGKIILIEIYRHSLRRFIMEIPRGYGKPGQSDEKNAHRELKEEIRGLAEELYPLGLVYENTGIGQSCTAIFLARLKRCGRPQKKEGIKRIVPVTIEEFEQMITSNEFRDNFGLCAYAKAKAMGLI